MKNSKPKQLLPAISDSVRLGIALGKFILWTRQLTPSPDGTLVWMGEFEIEGAQAAAERITRQIEAARLAAQVKSPAKAEAARTNGRAGGRPRKADATPAAVKRRASRAAGKKPFRLK